MGFCFDGIFVCLVVVRGWYFWDVVRKGGGVGGGIFGWWESEGFWFWEVGGR